MITDEEVFEGERSHLDEFWPDRPHEEFVWTLGPIGQSLPRFRVRRIEPARVTSRRVVYENATSRSVSI